MLLKIFALFCFTCKAENPHVSMQQNGTMVTVTQHCSKCTKGYVWRSQPFVHGKCPAGNVLLSFAVLMAGASISKILLVFRHMGLSVISSRTFFSHQRSFVFPTVIHHWESYRTQLINTLKNMKEVVWSGDGRFDSMGHSAKYGAYTMFCSTIMKVVHFELIQVRKNMHHAPTGTTYLCNVHILHTKNVTWSDLLNTDTKWTERIICLVEVSVRRVLAAVCNLMG